EVVEPVVLEPGHLRCLAKDSAHVDSAVVRAVLIWEHQRALRVGLERRHKRPAPETRGSCGVAEPALQNRQTWAACIVEPDLAVVVHAPPLESPRKKRAPGAQGRRRSGATARPARMSSIGTTPPCE